MHSNGFHQTFLKKHCLSINQKQKQENILSVFKDCLFNEPGKEPDSKTEMGLHTRTNPRLNFETSNRAKLQENIESIRKENELANYFQNKKR